MTTVQTILEAFEADIDGHLAEVENLFRECAAGEVDVSSRVVDGKRVNCGVSSAKILYRVRLLKLTFRLQIAKLWRQLTTGISAVLLFKGKHRTGVIKNMTLEEYTYAVRGLDSVIYVKEHKLGYTRPATIVLDSVMMERMDR